MAFEVLLPSSLSGLTVQSCLIFLIVFLLSWYVISTLYNHSKINLPPGPKGTIPVLLKVLRLGKGTITQKLIDMSKEYKSDVVCIEVGQSKMVFLNSYGTIKEAFMKMETVSDRTDTFFVQTLPQHKGIAGTNGLIWKEQRRFVLSTLRDFGMGKVKLLSKIQEELVHVMEDLDRKEGKTIDIQPIIYTAVSNIICSIVFGRRHNYDDQEFLELITTLDEVAKRVGKASIATDTFPLFQYLPGDLFDIKYVLQRIQIIRRFVRKKIAELKSSYSADDIRCFVDAYLAEVERKQEINRETTFTEEHLFSNVIGLFAAGTGTISTTLEWAILYMILHPDIQERVHKEINDVIGSDRLPTTADRQSLPYTEAVLSEVQRISSVSPLGLPHGNVEKDVEINGYTVPKNAIVSANIW